MREETPKIEVDFSDFIKCFKQLSEKLSNKEDEWKLTITSEMNGYVLEGDIEGIKHKWIIEEDEKDSLAADEKLLYEVMNYFGFQGSKHDSERLRVIREKKED
jgi:hypothetical protein